MARKHLKEECKNETTADMCLCVYATVSGWLETRSFFRIWGKICGKPVLEPISQGPDGVWV